MGVKWEKIAEIGGIYSTDKTQNMTISDVIEAKERLIARYHTDIMVSNSYNKPEIQRYMIERSIALSDLVIMLLEVELERLKPLTTPVNIEGESE